MLVLQWYKISYEVHKLSANTFKIPSWIQNSFTAWAIPQFNFKFSFTNFFSNIKFSGSLWLLTHAQVWRSTEWADDSGHQRMRRSTWTGRGWWPTRRLLGVARVGSTRTGVVRSGPLRSSPACVRSVLGVKVLGDLKHNEYGDKEWTTPAMGCTGNKLHFHSR